MLPIVPALLILLLQGPAGLERLAVGGQLPEALARLNSTAPAGGVGGAGKVESGPSRTLAALSALQQTNRDFAAALQLLLNAAAAALQPEIADSEPTACAEPTGRCSQEILRKPSDGFLCVARSRDGPA